MYKVICAAASRTDVIFVSGDIQRIGFRIVGLELCTYSDISTPLIYVTNMTNV
jgi:hypothetical protein